MRYRVFGRSTGLRASYLVLGDGGHPPLETVRPAGPAWRRALGSEILAPSDHLHAEGVADPCNRSADIAETQDTKRRLGHVTDRLLPSAAAQRRALGALIYAIPLFCGRMAVNL
jgi:hypothetical protein